MTNDPNQIQQSPGGQRQPESALAASPETPWKKVRNWLVAILTVLFILYIGFTRVYSFIDSFHDYPSDTVNTYYAAIKSQDYATAFSYLDLTMQEVTSGTKVTKADFIQQAKDIDAAKGPVKSYSITDVAPGQNVARVTQNETKSITVTVTRNGAPYDVNLTIEQIGTNTWLISKYDNI